MVEIASGNNHALRYKIISIRYKYKIKQFIIIYLFLYCKVGFMKMHY